MKYFKETIWPAFRKSMYQNTNYAEFHKAWKDNKTLTTYYKETLFPKIAADLELFYDGEEYLSMDAVFYKKNKIITNNWNIPVVFIKSENDINNIHTGRKGDELFKMCDINAPLKVIFTTGRNWNTKFHGYIKEWEDIAWYNPITKLTGYLVIIVVEKTTDSIDFNFVLFDDNGERMNEHGYTTDRISKKKYRGNIFGH